MDRTTLKTLWRAIIAFMLLTSFAQRVGGVQAAAGDILRVSVSSSGVEGNAYSRDADLSADGRFIVFWSGANNLVSGDTNDWEDLFVRDMQTGETTRISVSSNGTQADNASYYPAISSDGRYVAFMSDATNLVSGDSNGVSDIFLRDRQTGTTTRVSVGLSGAQGNGSSDSRVAISGDGRFITFNSDATNLVSGDTNNATDVFVRDLQSGVTERVSLDTNEVQGNGNSSDPSISSDGRFVSFSSSATNLVSGDTNASADIFVRDRLMGETTRVSVNSSGVEADRGAYSAAISGNGLFVTFSSESTNLLSEEPYGYPHVYVHDRQTGDTTLASITNDGYQMVGWSEMPDISADGRFIAFEFDDRGDGMAFRVIEVHDRLLGTTTKVSGPAGDNEDSSFNAAISADGRFVTFASLNNQLVPNDTNGWFDVFRRELAIPVPTIKTYQSIGADDGWVIESGENSGTGTRIDDRASTLFVGDANNDQQYLSILHFGTSSLPNNALISKVTLRIKKQGIVGTNPFTTHGDLLVDIRKPYFGAEPELKPTDFQASADRNAGTIPYAAGATWYTATLNESAFPFIDLAGTTQFRLRFALDDNDDNSADYMKFYSGDAGSADQPVLTIEYYLPATISPMVSGILRADPSPTLAPNVHFTVAFSEPVTGVDVTDFGLTTTGAISGAAIKSVSGSGDTYTVTVGTGSGSGTLRLDLHDDDSIKDATNNSLAGMGTVNGSYTNGEVYTVNKTANVEVYIGGSLRGQYSLDQNENARPSYSGVNSGPVEVTDPGAMPIVASQRVAYSPDGGNSWTSYSELMGLPYDQVTTSYIFPWYNNADLNTQLRFANVGNASTTVTVTVGGQVKGSYPLAPNASQRVSYVGLNAGPVLVTSSGGVPIIASERVAYFDGAAWTSFSELMGLPSNKLTTSYIFPWYNNADLNTQLRFGNVGNASTTVTVMIGGVVQGTYSLAPNASQRVSYAGLNAGPVKVTSSGGVPIIASERVAYFDGSAWTDFSELMGLPTSSLSNYYAFPVYNNVDHNSQLRFGNVGNTNTTVTVTIGGVVQGTYLLAPNQSARVSFNSLDDGPVVIASSGGVPIIASERVAYFDGNAWTSFSEMMGLPKEQLTSTYLFPWYNNVDLDTQLRFGVP